jgi:hypothetical protein
MENPALNAQTRPARRYARKMKGRLITTKRVENDMPVRLAASSGIPVAVC